MSEDDSRGGPPPRRRDRWTRRLVAVTALTAVLVAAASWWAGPSQMEPPWSPPPEPPPATRFDGTLELTVDPLVAPVDHPISVRVTGLAAGEPVTLRASTDDAGGVRFSSWARYRADAAGTLDLSRARPVSGTYRSADASGLLWSMRAGERSFVSSPEWTEREVMLTAEAGSRGATVTLRREYPWAGQQPTLVDHPRFSAQLWQPEPDSSTSEPPGLILLSGYGDGFSPTRAGLLASRGFAVLDVRYHGLEGGGRPELVEVPVEAVSDAVDLLAEHPGVGAERIGVFGTSKGAELALLAASVDQRIAAVAAWVPSSVSFAGISFRDPTPSSSWSIGGSPVPFASPPIDAAAIRNTLRLVLRRPVAFATSYRRALERAPVDAYIPVEQIAGPVLLAGGGDDRLWPSALMVAQIEARLEEHGFAYPVTALVFPEAGHGLTFALWPSTTRSGAFFDRGGTAEADHAAGQVTWSTTIGFFEAALK